MRVAPGAWRVAGPPLVVAIPLAVLAPVVAIACVGVGLGILWFFRDPVRTVPPEGVVTPADGTVRQIKFTEEGVLVSIFLGLTDVHVVRAPTAGRLTDQTYESGGHWPAFTKAADRNERLKLEITEGPYDIAVTLIAGTVARRITAYHDTGNRLHRGERIGHIAFGSRVDVWFPPSVTAQDLSVAAGDTVRAGETVLVAQPPTSDGGSR